MVAINNISKVLSDSIITRPDSLTKTEDHHSMYEYASQLNLSAMHVRTKGELLATEDEYFCFAEILSEDCNTNFFDSRLQHRRMNGQQAQC